MKPRLYISVVAALAASFSSCMTITSMLPNSRKGFTTYKHPVAENRNINTIKMNGIYISETGKAAFFLYTNGKVKIQSPFFNSPPQKFTETPEELISTMENTDYFNAKEWWGDYEIKDSEITIQWFNRVPDNICKRWVFEERGKVVSDSVIDINFSSSTKAKVPYLNGPCHLKFYPTNSKPDSTKAWFNGKQWYRNGLNKNRE